MKKTLMAIATAAAFVGGAHAADGAGDEVMQPRFGNTTVVTTAQGITIKIWYNADHTFTSDLGGMQASGTWKVESGQLCVTYANPMPGMTNPNCSPAVLHKIGDHWTVGEGSAQLSATLVAGKQ